MIERLRGHGIQASAQRVAVAEYALRTTDHPSADVVWAKVRESFPFLSRATVYNTLNLFVAKGLLRPLVIAEGRVVFDPNVEPHHHFVDEETGDIHDVPWDAVSIRSIDPPRDFELRDYQVIMRGSRRGRPSRARRGGSRSSVK